MSAAIAAHERPANLAPIPEWIRYSRRKVLALIYDLMHRAENRWMRFFPSDTWIGQQIGRSRETVNRAIAYLRKLGVAHRADSPSDPFGHQFRRTKETIIDWTALALMRDCPTIPVISRPTTTAPEGAQDAPDAAEVSEVQPVDPIALAGLPRVAAEAAPVAASQEVYPLESGVCSQQPTQVSAQHSSHKYYSENPPGVDSKTPPPPQTPVVSRSGDPSRAAVVPDGGVDDLGSASTMRAPRHRTRTAIGSDDGGDVLPEGAKRCLAMLLAASGDRLASVDREGWRRIKRALADVATARDLEPDERDAILAALPWHQFPAPKYLLDPVGLVVRLCVPGGRLGERNPVRADHAAMTRWRAWCDLAPDLRATVRAELRVPQDMPDARLMRDDRALHVARMILDAERDAIERERELVELMCPETPEHYAARAELLRAFEKGAAVIDTAAAERQKRRAEINAAAFARERRMFPDRGRA